MPSLQSFARLLAVVLCMSYTASIKADDVQDINQLFQKGDLSTALTRANQFLVKNPKDAQVRFLKGLILADQGKTAEAIQVFTAITEDYPELPEPYNNLAVLYAAQGKYEAAKNALEMAIRTHPSYATAHENLGDLYAKMASQAYDKALQIDNSNKAAQTKLALIKEMMSGKPQTTSGASQASSKPTLPQAPASLVATPQASSNAKPASPQAPTPLMATSQASSNAKPATPPATASFTENPQAAASLTANHQAASSVSAKPSAPVPAKPTMPAANVKPANIIETIQSWAKAWSSKDVDTYLAHYSSDFSPSNMSHNEWVAQRRERIDKPGKILVIARDIRVERKASDSASVHFKQVYQSDQIKSSSSKTLDLILEDGKWLIVRESGR
jgi:Tfp pilus assembly protein PilF